MKFTIRDEGSIVLFTPLTEAAQAWLEENLEVEGWRWWGKSLAVDHRMAQVLIDEINAEEGEIS